MAALAPTAAPRPTPLPPDGERVAVRAGDSIASTDFA